MPGLHISLGIFYRLFTLLETSCHQWDLDLAQHASQPGTQHSYKLKQELSAETEEASAADQLATFLAVRGMPRLRSTTVDKLHLH